VFITELVNSRPSAGAEDALHWHAQIDANHDTVAAVLNEHLLERPSPAGVHLVGQLAEYWFYRGRVAEGARWLEAALRQVETPPFDRALVGLALAYIHALRGRTDLSLGLVRDALSLSRPAAQPDLHAYAYGLVAAAWCVWVNQDPALDFVDEDVRRLAQGDPVLELWADVLTAKNALATDGPAAVSARAAGLIERAYALGNHSAAWLAAWLDVLCTLLMGQAAAGQVRLEQVNDLYHRLGGGPTANAVEFEANFAALANDLPQAAYLFGKASRLAFTAGIRWPVSPATHEVLQQVRQRLTAQGGFDAAWRAGDADARTII
jgi:hypothetical protein